MSRRRRVPRGLAAGILLVTALAGGPGLAGLEAYHHAHRSTPGHSQQAHFEALGGQDHNDVCGASRVSSPVRLPGPCGLTARAREPFTPSLQLTDFPLVSSDLALLPPTRAPPSR